jgi:cytochrome c-type biogenesis protein CcmH/NrfG
MGYAYLGDAYRRGSKFSDAIAAYEQALAIEPQNPTAKSGIAKAKAQTP